MHSPSPLIQQNFYIKTADAMSVKRLCASLFLALLMMSADSSVLKDFGTIQRLSLLTSSCDKCGMTRLGRKILDIKAIYNDAEVKS